MSLVLPRYVSHISLVSYHYDANDDGIDINEVESFRLLLMDYWKL